MSPAQREHILATSLEDFRMRRTRGERPSAAEYAEGLADAYDEFLEILGVEALLDDLLEPPPEPTLPQEFGPYTLLREIGRGAAGIVYEAENRELGRREAVKILRTQIRGNGSTLDRFRQEVQVLASVNHPNIVEVYAASQHDGQSYYAMALVDGVPLSELVRAGDLPEPEELCRGLAGVAEALDALHGRGILHRDVKPSNIIVEPSGRMVLTDFGLVRLLSQPHLTLSGTTLGTPLYMSPEQVRGRDDEIDCRTDVYGLGATLYEALSGRPVFETEDLRAVMGMVRDQRPEPLTRVSPQIPPSCADIAMKAIEKQPEDRYASASAMGNDLRAFAAGEEVQGRPVSTLRRHLRTMRKFALPAAALVVIGVLLAVWMAGRPGVLVVFANCPAEVIVNGVPHGTAPTRVHLAPGDYTVRFRHELVDPRPYDVSIRAGVEREFFVIPGPTATGDRRETFEFLMGAAGLESAKERIRPRERDGIPDVYLAALPAGRVRLDDLDAYRLEVSEEEELPEGTRFVFRRDGETLYSAPWAHASTLPVTKPLPADVVEKLSPGDEVTWGLDVPGRDDVLTSFVVVPADASLDLKLARLDAVLVNQTPALAAAARAQTLLDHGLALAAFGEVEAVVDAAAPEDAGLAPWVMRQEALAELGLANVSELWGDGEMAIWYTFPHSLVNEWYVDEESAD